ncbi:hypothetical protein [Leeuwenhoekiella sp. H156]|uniref:hypothetical protein n=1 Tax=Leeuwenhoekiella sp. H156 TaxID=3450128 RepID=UPI003FA48B47
MKSLGAFVLSSIMLLCCISCELITEKKTQVKDKLFPTFDSEISDTPANKRRFAEFIKVKLSPDVKNIYCFDDAIGINSDYMFSFSCNEATAQEIIEIHNLDIDTINVDNAFSLQHDFDWWNKEDIRKLQKYSWSNGNNYHKYFWYDSRLEKAYFFDFDL